MIKLLKIKYLEFRLSALERGLATYDRERKAHEIKLQLIKWGVM